MQESVEVPEEPRLTVEGVRTQLRPEGTAADRLTVLVNPLMLVTAMVELPTVPRLMVIDTGLADTAKSWIAKLAVAVRDDPRLLPVTVTV